MMKAISLSFAVVAALACGSSVFAPRLAAQEGVADAAGPQHQALMKRAGSYDVVTKFHMPGAPAPMESKGEATLKSACGGRFLHEENSGEMMNEKFTGMRLLGYNNSTQNYEASWVYSQSTSILQLAGKSGDGGKTIRMSGEVTDQGEKMTFRVEYHFTSDDQFTVKLFAGPPGEEGPALEETYTRRKK